MKVRLIIAARATVGAVLVAVTVAACTGGGSAASSVPSIFTPFPATQSPAASGPVKTPTVGHGTATGQSSGKASSSAKASSPAKATSKATSAPRPSAKGSPGAKASRSGHRPAATRAPKAQTPVPVASPYPVAAPETGGGGTAGLQDGLLFAIGGAAILAGLGSLGYRRRLRRKHQAGPPARTDTPTRTGIR